MQYKQLDNTQSPHKRQDSTLHTYVHYAAVRRFAGPLEEQKSTPGEQFHSTYSFFAK
jgi:hypothetical protein